MAGAAAPKSYVVVNGLRYVAPYMVEQDYRVKDAMAGMSIVDLLATCFRLQKGEQDMDEARAYWQSVVDGGRVSVKRRRASRDDVRPITEGHVVVTDGAFVTAKQDHIKIKKHMHERVVNGAVPEVLLDDGDWLIINKPPGIPAVASEDGLNNVVDITRSLLAGGKRLYLIHRIDAPVSGILLMCRSGATYKPAIDALAQREAKKQYVARVKGCFPAGGAVCDRALAWCSKGNHAKWGYDEEESGGEWRASAGGSIRARANTYKPAKTSFELLHYLPEHDESVVLASPVSGYRHQIRAHLAVLGFPIANDATYHGWAAVPPGTPHSVLDAAPAAEEPPGTPPAKKQKTDAGGGGRCCSQRRAPQPARPVQTKQAVYVDDEARTLHKVLEATRQPWCPKCQWVTEILAGTSARGNPDLDGLIYLHARRYIIPALKLDVTSPMPTWAAPPPAPVADS
eukprot:TRINITY_DN19837_c0_g1_i1.p1 TRINITY_DN19837_c0_g1~~TRINITY_DN19837_c0_g1_i1.p1  ORF type:complete len:510 (+),score=169.40 TRINITY_DN19837_c0_g1_i1:168-1532(+)